MRELGPAAQYFGVFERSAASLFRFPVPQQNVLMMRFSIAIEQIAGVSTGCERGNESLHGGQRRLFVPRQGLEDGDRKYFVQRFLRHEDYCLRRVNSGLCPTPARVFTAFAASQCAAA